MTLTDAKDIASIVASVATIGAGLVAGYWFLFTRSYKTRIEFDADLKFFDTGTDHYVGELILTISNKGQREHHLHNLWCEVRQTRSTTDTPKIASYLPVNNLVPEDLDYFFIPPGIDQKFPRSFLIPKSEKLVRVVAVFAYEAEGFDLSTLEHLTFEELDKFDYTTDSVSKLFAVRPS